MGDPRQTRNDSVFLSHQQPHGDAAYQKGGQIGAQGGLQGIAGVLQTKGGRVDGDGILIFLKMA